MPSAREARAAREAERDASGILPPPPLARGQVLLRTLGVAEVHVGGVGVVSPAAERMFSLLVLGAMTPDHAMARDDVLALVWPDADREGARHSLRQHLYKLRGWGVPIQATRATVTLSRACLVPCFALDRTAALFDRDVLRGGEPFGHLFAGWTPTIPAMRRWVEDQRDRFQMDVRRILIPELRRLRDRADWLECERWARTVLEFDPYNEDGMLVLAEAIAMQGSRHSAHTMLDGYVRETGMAGTDLAQDLEAAQRRIGRATRVRHEAAATPTLVGRDAEVRQLDAITLAALQGQTQVVHITGPAGIGKTELAYEATRRAVILGFTRCIVRVTRAMGQMPLGMLSRLVRDLLRLPGALGCRPEHLRLLTALSQETLDVEALSSSDAPKSSIHEAVHDLVMAVSEEGPLFLVLDDIIHSDSSSIHYLRSALSLSAHIRLVAVATLQRGATLEGTVAQAADLALTPLSLPASTALAESVRSATGRQLRREDAETIAVASAGVPMAIIAGARGALVNGLTPDAEARNRDGIQRQLQGLTPSARVVLQTLALLGGRTATGVLDLVLELRLPDRLSAVRELLSASLVEEGSDDEVTCHSLIAEACLSSVTRTERSLIQRATVRAVLQAPVGGTPVALDVAALQMSGELAEETLATPLLLSVAPRMIELGMTDLVVPHLETSHRRTNSADSRRRLLELLVRASEKRADWHRVLGAAEALRCVAPASGTSPNVRLAEIEAAVRCGIDGGMLGLAHEAAGLAGDRSVDDQDRIHAARLAIGAASDLFLPEVSEAALFAIHRVCQSRFTQDFGAIEAEMQHHTIFGDLDTALTIALRAGPLMERGDLSNDEVRFVLNAAYVRRIAGHLSEAEALFSIIRELPMASRTLARRAFATWQLSLIALDRDDERATRYWSRELDEMLAGQPREAWHLMHQRRVELLLASPAAPSGGRIPAEIGDAIRANEISRGNAYRIALELAAACKSNSDDPEAVVLGSVVAQRCGSYLGQDLLISALATLHFQQGRESDAEALLSRYLLHERRERFEPLSMRRVLPEVLWPAIDHLRN